MSLSPISKPLPLLTEQRWAVFDLEWYPTCPLYGEPRHKSAACTDCQRAYELRLIGVFDGRRYRRFHDIHDFLDWCSINAPITLYAHYGGKADFVFLVAPLVARGASVEAALNGSSCICMSYEAGRGRKVEFRDSFWLFHDKLANVAAAFTDLKKGDCAFDAPLSELEAYNELDCCILYKAIVALEAVWLELGGGLALTNAACAMYLFRRRYLTREIATDPAMNVWLRNQSLVASRCEAHVTDVRGALRRAGVDHAESWDMNSAHPSQYMKPLPANLLSLDDSGKRFNFDDPHKPLYADVMVRVPYHAIPPLPKKVPGGVIWPYGRFRGVYNDVQLRFLEECGGSIEKVYTVARYEAFYDLAACGQALYDVRMKYGKTSPQGIIAKLGANSIAGKFAQSAERQRAVFGPIRRSDLRKADVSLPPNERLYILSDGFAIQAFVQPVAHQHLPLSCHIVSSTACDVSRGARIVHEAGSIVLYFDTDGIKGTACKLPHSLPISKKLGEWDHEYTFITDGRFIAPKMYALRDDKAKCKGRGASIPACSAIGWRGAESDCEACHGRPGEIVRAKGMRKLTYEQAMQLTGAESGLEEDSTGPAVRVVRMARMRELIRDTEARGSRKGREFAPRDVVVNRRYRGNGVVKRLWAADGSSEPLEVIEQ